MKNIIIALVLLWTASNCFSQDNKPVSFTDQISLEVVNASRQVRIRENKLVEITKISIVGKEFTADLTGIGKAVPPLAEQTLNSAAKKKGRSPLK